MGLKRFFISNKRTQDKISGFVLVKYYWTLSVSPSLLCLGTDIVVAGWKHILIIPDETDDHLLHWCSYCLKGFIKLELTVRIWWVVRCGLYSSWKVSTTGGSVTLCTKIINYLSITNSVSASVQYLVLLQFRFSNISMLNKQHTLKGAIMKRFQPRSAHTDGE